MALRLVHIGHRAFKSLAQTKPGLATAASRKPRYVQVGARAYQTTLPMLASLGPPEHQLVVGKAMPVELRDIDDVNPNRRTAKLVAGHRAYDPLRWYLKRRKERSVITIEMILAADRLRLLADACAIGLSGGKDRFNLQFVSYVATPSTGPGWADIKSAQAWPKFRRAMAMFDAGERDLVTHIILLNTTVDQYRRVLRDQGKVVVDGGLTAALVKCLERLVRHFRHEVDQAIGRGESI
jgi:hypothetical protein